MITGAPKPKPKIIRKWPPEARYIVCVDESGDRGLINLDPNWPILSICGIILDRATYSAAGKKISALKTELWPPEGKDAHGRRVCFHSRDMRLKLGPFSEAVLKPEQRQHMDKVVWQELIGSPSYPFIVLAAIIDKDELTRQYAYPDDPYLLAVTFILERLVMNVREPCFVLFESRGKREDYELNEYVAQLFIEGSGYVRAQEFTSSIIDYGFHKKFDEAGETVCGLELADLCAYTLGNWYRQRKPNRFSNCILPKICGYTRKDPSRILGRGLKIFPEKAKDQLARSWPLARPPSGDPVA